MTVPVNVDNFVKISGETTKWHHVRAPAKPGELGAVVQTNRHEDGT